MGVTLCPTCTRKFGLFRWRYHCYECKGVRCRDCLTSAPSQVWICEGGLSPREGDGYCRDCAKRTVQPFVARYNAALSRAEAVEHWSINYQGKTPHQYDGPTHVLMSDEFEEKADAILQLQVTAAFLGFDLLIKVQTHHRLEKKSEPSNNGRGTHYYNEPRYRASGTAAMRYQGRRSESREQPGEPSRASPKESGAVIRRRPKPA